MFPSALFNVCEFLPCLSSMPIPSPPMASLGSWVSWLMVQVGERTPPQIPIIAPSAAWNFNNSMPVVSGSDTHAALISCLVGVGEAQPPQCNLAARCLPTTGTVALQTGGCTPCP
eukprot:EG_transcript_34344